MDKRSRRLETWETKESLEEMIDRGLGQFRLRSELSGGWKKAGIITGMAAVFVGAALAVGYLGKNFPVIPAQAGAVVDSSSVGSSLGIDDAIDSATDGAARAGGEYGSVRSETEVSAKEAFEPEATYTPQTAGTALPAESNPDLGASSDFREAVPEDMFTVLLSKARLYGGGYQELIEDIRAISRSSETLLYAKLHDENNTLEVRYEGVDYPETFPVEESTIDSLIDKSKGPRHESTEIGGKEFGLLLEKAGSSRGDYASAISGYCSGWYESGLIESYLADALIVNFVPDNGEYPLLNILTPDGVYTFYAKGNENMQILMDLAGVPK